MSAPPTDQRIEQRRAGIEVGIAEHEERAERALAAQALEHRGVAAHASSACLRGAAAATAAAPATRPCRRDRKGRRGWRSSGSSSASFSAWAKACADSNAQMIPSLSASSRERGERFGVGRADIFGAAALLEVRVLGPDRGIIEARGNRPGVGDLPVRILKHVGFRAVEDARRARAAESRHGLLPVEPAAPRPPHRSAARRPSRKSANRPIAFDPPPTQATTASRQAPDLLEHLRARLAADHPLELADHRRERVRPGGGAEQVMRGLEARRPVAQRLVDRVLEGPAAAFHRDHAGRPSAAFERR